MAQPTTAPLMRSHATTALQLHCVATALCLVSLSHTPTAQFTTATACQARHMHPTHDCGPRTPHCTSSAEGVHSITQQTETASLRSTQGGPLCGTHTQKKETEWKRPPKVTLLSAHDRPPCKATAVSIPARMPSPSFPSAPRPYKTSGRHPDPVTHAR